MFRPWENRKVQQNGPFQDQQEMGPDEQVKELSYDETQWKRKRHLHSDARELIFNVHQSLVRRGYFILSSRCSITVSIESGCLGIKNR
jgi:hypothetical protein